MAENNRSIKIDAVVAMCDKNRGIGFKGRLPWSLPEEFQYYMNVITRTQDPSKYNALVFGRYTWTDFNHIFPDRLPTHVYIIISNTLKKEELQLNGKIDPNLVYIVKTYHDAIQLALNDLKDQIETIHVNGGIQIYRSAIEYELFDYLYLTHVYGDFECDVFMQPENFLESFKKVENFKTFATEGHDMDVMYTDPASGVQYKTIVYERK